MQQKQVVVDAAPLTTLRFSVVFRTSVLPSPTTTASLHCGHRLR